MRWMGRFACAALIAAGLAGCGGAGADSESAWDKVVAPSVLETAGLKVYWRYQVPIPRGEKVDRIWRLDENLYLLTDENRLICVDAVRGLYKWSNKIADPAQRVFPPCHADGVLLGEATGVEGIIHPEDTTDMTAFDAVLVNTLNEMVVLNRTTGEQRRRMALNFAANTGGACDGLNLYLGSVRGWYYAVRLREGIPEWVMGTEDMISAAPRLYNRRVFVASHDGLFRAVAPEKARSRHVWTQETDGPLTGQFEVNALGCFVPSQDYKLYCYDDQMGNLRWEFRTQGPLREAVQVGAKTVFQFADRDVFYAIDAATGRQRWTNERARVVLMAHGPFVYILAADRHLQIVHEMLGKVESSLPMTGLDFFAPNARHPVMFVGTADGRFMCLRPAGETGQLTAAQLKD